MACGPCEARRRRLAAAARQGNVVETVKEAAAGAVDLAKHVVTGEAPKASEDKPK